MPDQPLFRTVAKSLSPDAHRVRAWLALVSCFTSIERALMRHFAQAYNSSLPRYDVLTALSLHPDGLTMGQLAAKLVVTKGNTTGVVRRLSADGLVKKVASKTDGRVQLVTISARGRAMWQNMHDDYNAIIDELLSGISATETKKLARALDQARRSVDRKTLDEN